MVHGRLVTGDGRMGTRLHARPAANLVDGGMDAPPGASYGFLDADDHNGHCGGGREANGYR